MRLGTILLVNRDQDDAVLTCIAWKRAGLSGQWLTVGTVREAVAYLLGTQAFQDHSKYPRPDLLVLDSNLRDKASFELLRWIRSQAQLKDLNTVMLFEYASEGDRLQAASLGVRACIERPFALTEFENALRNLGQSEWLQPWLRAVPPAQACRAVC